MVPSVFYPVFTGRMKVAVVLYYGFYVAPVVLYYGFYVAPVAGH